MGRGKGKIRLVGFRFSLECNYLKNHMKPVVASLQRLHSVLGDHGGSFGKNGTSNFNDEMEWAWHVESHARYADIVRPFCCLLVRGPLKQREPPIIPGHSIILAHNWPLTSAVSLTANHADTNSSS